jgi:3-hydroxyacyl-[acyl-carrier-protein] dehydratase
VIGLLPSAGSLEVLSRTADHVSGMVKTDPADPVFAGHYPGFPLLPGLYLVEFTHRTVLAVADGQPTLDAIEICRFLKPVYAGDEVILEISLSGDDDGLRCRATASTGLGRVAEIRLRYLDGTA